MSSITDLEADVNELWQEIVMYVPTRFIRLSARGVEPELAADLVADDGLPVCEPIDVADDGNEVYVWTGMYEAVS